jgi:putative membrane protein
MPRSLIQILATDWSVPLLPTLGVLAAGILYARGWRLARRTRPRKLPAWRALCFFSGLISLWLALASPLDALNEYLLSAHMAQHLLLMSVAPPLLLLGSPLVPMLRGLPRGFVRQALAPCLNSRCVRWPGRLFANPYFGWLSMDLSMALWHIPAAYELTLRSEVWHETEHGCFFFTGLAFWWFVVRPWPSRIRSSRWWIIPYVSTAHMVMGSVALFIGLQSRVIYPSYAELPRLFGISPLADQGIAGDEMLYVGLIDSLITIIPIMWELVSEEPPPLALAAPEPPVQERFIGDVRSVASK